MRERVYEIFARKSRGEPLRHVGYLDALDDELARVYAWKTYDEENWFEMCVVPRAAIIPVNREDGPFVRPTPGRADARPRAADAAREVPEAQSYGGER